MGQPRNQLKILYSCKKKESIFEKLLHASDINRRESQKNQKIEGSYSLKPCSTTPSNNFGSSEVVGTLESKLLAL